MINKNIGAVLLLTLIVFMALGSLGAPAAASVGPLEQIKSTVTGIVGVMQSKELGQPDKKIVRREKIMAYVSQRFDFEEISKQTLAGNWRELSPEQRKNFERLFSELLKNTYIGRVEAYSNEVIKFDKEVYDGDQRAKVMVYTKVIKDNQEIPINYKLMAKKDDWFVYDVMIEGVSLIRNYRTEFARIINQEKYPGLIKRLQEKIDKKEEAKN